MHQPTLDTEARSQIDQKMVAEQGSGGRVDSQLVQCGKVRRGGRSGVGTKMKKKSAAVDISGPVGRIDSNKVQQPVRGDQEVYGSPPSAPLPPQQPPADAAVPRDAAETSP